MDQELAGRVAVVTGGATGIGLATARALATDGAAVYIAVRDSARGRRVAAEESARGLDIRAVLMDVSDAESVGAAFLEVDDAGRLDILVNNAGINMVGRVEDLSEAGWDAALDTNLKGPFLVARQAIPRMRSTGGGVIVNVSSNAGLVARADEPAYSTSKAGLLMLTRALARAHAEDRIRVNAVCPGPVGDTGIMDQNLAQAPDPVAALATYLKKAPLAAAWGRLIDPDEVAALIRFLCSDAAAMITGAIVAVDGGKSLEGGG
ncbi:MAG TPA: SDR family NAD(P)-dependent oxidoreductase [Candidatus Deferrimicrobium sp.]|nr:SDR family NAD(P)-dependent oxidoreductase [Candidatus Deferrimicrobium sp.]